MDGFTEPERESWQAGDARPPRRHWELRYETHLDATTEWPSSGLNLGGQPVLSLGVGRLSK